MHSRARRGLGYLPQEVSVFRKLSVRNNILPFWKRVMIYRQRSGSQ